MTFFNALRIVAIIHICFFSAQNLYAKSDICKGRWAYNKYKLCTHCNFGIKSHVVKRSERCGVEQYNQGRGDVCGVESWKEERGPICGVERYKESPRSLNPGALTLRTPSVESYRACRHSAFGVERYNLCRHQNFGVHSYKECALPEHGSECNTGTGAVCGVESTILFSERNLHKNSVRAGALTLVNDGTSACTTCDDLSTDTANAVKTLFQCLKVSIENAEEGKSGYSLPDLKVAVKAIKDLEATASCYLLADDVQYVTDVINNYPQF